MHTQTVSPRGCHQRWKISQSWTSFSDIFEALGPSPISMFAPSSLDIRWKLWFWAKTFGQVRRQNFKIHTKPKTPSHCHHWTNIFCHIHTCTAPVFDIWLKEDWTAQGADCYSYQVWGGRGGGGRGCGRGAAWLSRPCFPPCGAAPIPCGVFNITQSQNLYGGSERLPGHLIRNLIFPGWQGTSLCCGLSQDQPCLSVTSTCGWLWLTDLEKGRN